MFIPPQFRADGTPTQPRGVVFPREDSSPELIFPSIDCPPSIKIAACADVAASEKGIAHWENKKKRAAKSQLVGDFGESLEHAAKREDNSSHDDKTVSLDSFWKAKAEGMNIDVSNGLPPSPVIKAPPPPYDGAVTGIPPLPNKYIAEVLMAHHAGCPKACAWVKAQETCNIAVEKVTFFEKAKEELDNAEAAADRGVKHSNPHLLRFEHNQKQKKRRQRKRKGKNSTAQDTTQDTALPGPSMDHDAVKEALAIAKLKDAHAAVNAAVKATVPEKDISPESASQTETEREREYHLGIIDRIENARHALVKTMHGEGSPTSEPRPVPAVLAEDRPSTGFTDLAKEKAFHAAFIDHVQGSCKRLEDAMEEMRISVVRNRLQAAVAAKVASPAPKPSPDPMGLRCTPLGMEDMEKANQQEPERKIDPEALRRVRDASMRLQRAMLGDDVPKMNKNDMKF